MEFNPQEYEKLQARMRELQRDKENFKKYQEQKAQERNKFGAVAEAIYNDLLKKKYAPADIASIGAKIRNKGLKENNNEEE